MRAPVQRIVYAQNEANYCAKCQTGGRLLSKSCGALIALTPLTNLGQPRSPNHFTNSNPVAVFMTDNGTRAPVGDVPDR